MKQFSSVSDARDPIEQFSFDAGVTRHCTFSGSDQLLKGDHCIDTHDCKSVFGDSVDSVRKESGALDGVLEDDGFMSNSADVASVAGSSLDMPASSAGFDHSSIQTACVQSLEPHAPKFMWGTRQLLEHGLWEG